MVSTSTRDALQETLQHLPDELLEELQDYMQYLQYKAYRQNPLMNTAYASEAALKKDWNSPEEDQAWQSL